MVHTKRERREIGQDNQFLAAQAAHASMVASHSRYGKRSRELFDDSREFVGGVHYAIGHSHPLHPISITKSFADIMVNTPVYVSIPHNLSIH
jgi:hypothetical protein